MSLPVQINCEGSTQRLLLDAVCKFYIHSMNAPVSLLAVLLRGASCLQQLREHDILARCCGGATASDS